MRCCDVAAVMVEPCSPQSAVPRLKPRHDFLSVCPGKHELTIASPTKVLNIWRNYTALQGNVRSCGPAIMGTKNPAAAINGTPVCGNCRVESGPEAWPKPRNSPSLNSREVLIGDPKKRASFAYPASEFIGRSSHPRDRKE
jgi:hypothetical protein